MPYSTRVLVVAAGLQLFACAKSNSADKSCLYEGDRHDVGDTFPSSDGCNSCSCGNDGQVACTLRACVDAGIDAGPAPALAWYKTCGAPVCGPQFDGPTGEPKCNSEVEGGACATKDRKCDPGLGCAVNLVCADSDPTAGLGGCPISRARFKRDIRYLDQGELSRLSDALLAMPLAHWRYKQDDSATDQMGFIIEDVEPSPSVAGDHVNLYGYTSMAVAALKVQSQQMRALEQEVLQMRSRLLQLEQRCNQPRDP